MTTILRKTAAGALSTAARVMALGSRLTGQAADLVRGSDGRRPDGSPEPEKTDEVLEVIGQDRQSDAARRATVTEPPTEPVPEGPSHVRTHATHAEELASRSASEVIAAVPSLSTDELRRLYEEETAGRKRKTVLAAIEAAADPTTDKEPPGHIEPMSEAGGVPTGGGPPR